MIKIIAKIKPLSHIPGKTWRICESLVRKSVDDFPYLKYAESGSQEINKNTEWEGNLIISPTCLLLTF